MQKAGRNKLSLGSIAYRSLETQTRTPEAALLPLSPLGPGVSLGHLGCGKACPGSPARSEVTWSCVETTPVKCHGNGRAVTPTGLRGGESSRLARSESAENTKQGGACGRPQAPLGASSVRGQWLGAVDSGECM